jgi:alpha-glucosidase
MARVLLELLERAEGGMQARKWWQNGVIYQLLVPSFADGSGDGLGDFEGLTERLDYLKWLGVDGLWLSPFHRTPFKEFGYDVADYASVDSRFGSLESFDRFVAAAHRRGLHVILDWVGNHTSDEHPWFVESRSSRDNPKRNWYIWRDGKPDGSPPNNWISVFGGTVWQRAEPTGQYYLHTFLASQPDLNWREPAVREAMHDTVRFWLDRDVDGFRIDATALMIKDERLRDNPPNPDYRDGDLPDSQQRPVYSRNQPGMHELLAEIRAMVDSHDRVRAEDRVLLGEFYLPVDELVTFYGDGRPELHLPVNLVLTWTEWTAQAVGRAIDEYQRSVPAHGWPTTTLTTHDQPRIARRASGDQARVAAMLLFTQRGTPTLYYGDELGMRGAAVDRLHARDPQGRRTGRNRDPERTPMQWSADRYAGFSSVAPWLPPGADLATANVAAQRADPRSMLALHRRLIELRKREPVLVDGAQSQLEREPPIVAYRRGAGARELLVALNFGSTQASCALEPSGRGRLLLSTTLERDGEEIVGAVRLAPNEGAVIALES